MDDYRQPMQAAILSHGLSLSLSQEYGTAPASVGLDRLLSDALEKNSSQPGLQTLKPAKTNHGIGTQWKLRW